MQGATAPQQVQEVVPLRPAIGGAGRAGIDPGRIQHNGAVEKPPVTCLGGPGAREIRLHQGGDIVGPALQQRSLAGRSAETARHSQTAWKTLRILVPYDVPYAAEMPSTCISVSWGGRAQHTAILWRWTMHCHMG